MDKRAIESIFGGILIVVVLAAFVFIYFRFIAIPSNAVMIYNASFETGVVVNMEAPFAVNFAAPADTKQLIINVEGSDLAYSQGAGKNKHLYSSISATLNNAPMTTFSVASIPFGEDKVQFRISTASENNTLRITANRYSVAVNKLSVLAVPNK